MKKEISEWMSKTLLVKLISQSYLEERREEGKAWCRVQLQVLDDSLLTGMLLKLSLFLEYASGPTRKRIGLMNQWVHSLLFFLYDYKYAVSIYTFICRHIWKSFCVYVSHFYLKIDSWKCTLRELVTLLGNTSQRIFECGLNFSVFQTIYDFKDIFWFTS